MIRKKACSVLNAGHQMASVDAKGRLRFTQPALHD